MTANKILDNQEKYLNSDHVNRGVGFWRNLYAELLNKPALNNRKSIIELGSGSPDFLKIVPMTHKVAIDVSDKYQEEFNQAGINFYIKNLEHQSINDLGMFDIAVCSDVFEHLLNPENLLEQIRTILNKDGILLSHVPNEYELKFTLLIMFGLREGLYFHRDSNEWDDPHIRRFTDRGYNKFLSLNFKYNIKITQLRYRLPAKALHLLKIPVPLCLEGGATYISTNCQKTFQKLKTTIN